MFGSNQNVEKIKKVRRGDSYDESFKVKSQKSKKPGDKRNKRAWEK